MDIKLIIGLGNPDKKYANTYHSAGFLFIDYLKENPVKLKVKSLKFKVLKSDEYMNNSGTFVAQAMKKEGVKSEELLIAHDDSDLELGTYKLQSGRGAAGHHGVESIQAALKTNDFWRLRIGIRPKADLSAGARRAKAEEFVLKKISPENKKILERVFEEVVDKLKI